MALPSAASHGRIRAPARHNHFGHFALTGLLLPAVLQAGQSKPARIITVSSLATAAPPWTSPTSSGSTTTNPGPLPPHQTRESSFRIRAAAPPRTHSRARHQHRRAPRRLATNLFAAGRDRAEACKPKSRRSSSGSSRNPTRRARCPRSTLPPLFRFREATSTAQWLPRNARLSR